MINTRDNFMKIRDNLLDGMSYNFNCQVYVWTNYTIGNHRITNKIWHDVDFILGRSVWGEVMFEVMRKCRVI